MDVPEGSGVAELVASMLRWKESCLFLDHHNIFTSPDTLLGMEINQGNGSNVTESALNDSISTECSSNDCRHHTYDTLSRQLRGGGEVVFEKRQSNHLQRIIRFFCWSGL